MRIYYRAKRQLKTRLRGTPWTPEFMAQYEDAKRKVKVMPSYIIAPGTWRWLCVEYFKSADYLRLDSRFQRVRRGVLENTFDEPIAPDSPKLFRDMPLSKMDANAIEVLRDRKMEFPEGANNRVKAIRAVFKWAVRKKHRDGKPYVAHNAARDVSYFESNNPDGYHTWTVEEVRKFQKRHPLGTKAHLALALLLFTGQRRSDMCGSDLITSAVASLRSLSSRAGTASRSNWHCRCWRSFAA